MAEVTFQIDRFEWAGDGRLELAGRWFGLRGHRFLRPTLDVDVDGERRRMLADLEHKPWAADDGADWVAAFTWRGDPAPFDDAELTVSPDLAVQLPAVGGAARANSGKASGTVERRPAGPSRTTVLEGELASAMSEAQRLREQLSAEQTNVRGLDSQLRQARAELATAQAEAEAARAEAEAARAAETEARDESSLARAEAERARADAEAAREEARMAVPEADGLRAELVSAQRDLESALARVTASERELAAATEARDRARDERNAWMQRARAAAAGRPSAARAPTHGPEPRPDRPTAAMPPREPGSAPEPVAGPAAERRTIQIGERARPARTVPAREVHPPIRRRPLDGRAPRLLAVVVLLVLVALLLALIFLVL